MSCIILWRKYIILGIHCLGGWLSSSLDKKGEKVGPLDEAKDKGSAT
jgi:hypothetical protein